MIHACKGFHFLARTSLLKSAIKFSFSTSPSADEEGELVSQEALAKFQQYL